MITWLREAADELEKAHTILDAHGAPRFIRDAECTLGRRIVLALERERP